METRFRGFDPEQVGADRLGEDRIVNQQRDKFSGLLAGALPAGADLGTIGAPAAVNPEVRRILAIAGIGQNDGE